MYILFFVILVVNTLSLENAYCLCKTSTTTYACQRYCQFIHAQETCGKRVRLRKRKKSWRTNYELRRSKRIYNGHSTRIHKSPWSIKLQPLGFRVNYLYKVNDKIILLTLLIFTLLTIK